MDRGVLRGASALGVEERCPPPPVRSLGLAGCPRGPHGYTRPGGGSGREGAPGARATTDPAVACAQLGFPKVLSTHTRAGGGRVAAVRLGALPTAKSLKHSVTLPHEKRAGEEVGCFLTGVTLLAHTTCSTLLVQKKKKSNAKQNPREMLRGFVIKKE